MDSELEQLRADVAALRGRVLKLEECVFKRHRLSLVIKELVERWPGPFTAQQIRQAIRERHPDALEPNDNYRVEAKLRWMEKAGFIVCTHRGNGRLGSIYERAANGPALRFHGNKMNVKHSYESGFRHIVRTALNDLPAEFRLDDLRKWMAEHMPEADIPYGSWASTLYKLQEADELVVVKRSHYNCGKVYARGPKRVAPDGDEIRALEASWQEFRKTVKAEIPNYVPFGRREDVEAKA
jgi:hypothetical protein